MRNNYVYHSGENTVHLLVNSKGKQYEGIINDHSLPGVVDHRWSLTPEGYLESWMDGGNIRLHRYLMKAHLSEGLEVDHVNGNKLDNRIENLRIVTRQQNQFNSKPSKNSFSKYKGVSFDKNSAHKKPIFAQIMHNRKNYRLGTYTSEEEAARAYDKKAIELFGEYAYLNFPEGAL